MASIKTVTVDTQRTLLFIHYGIPCNEFTELDICLSAQSTRLWNVSRITVRWEIWVSKIVFLKILLRLWNFCCLGNQCYELSKMCVLQCLSVAVLSLVCSFSIMPASLSRLPAPNNNVHTDRIGVKNKELNTNECQVLCSQWQSLCLEARYPTLPSIISLHWCPQTILVSWYLCVLLNGLFDQKWDEGEVNKYLHVGLFSLYYGDTFHCELGQWTGLHTRYDLLSPFN